MSVSPLPFKLIIVTGCMRSGTSLLHRLVSTSPDTGERLSPARFIADFLLLIQRYRKEDSAFAMDYFQSPGDLVLATRQFVEARLHDAWVHSGMPPCLVLRTVEIAPMLSLVAELLPEAKFAISVREPKDTITSILNVRAKQKMLEGRRNSLTAKRDVGRLCKTYNRAYLTIMRKQRSDEQFRNRIVFVRYEDAVANSAEALREVWQRFGLTPGSGTLPADPVTRPSIAQILIHRFWRSFRTDLSEAPVSARSVGSHRSVLKTSEIWSVNWRCRILRRAFGYSSDDREI
ncbi:MAG: sulfotransferase [Mesorhizobium sp.]